MIIIGSAAIKQHYPDFPRVPKDLDYIGVRDYDFCTDLRFEKLENPIIEKLYENDKSSYYIKKDDLLTLKASHLCWDINWEKHLFDTQFLLKKGCKIDYKLFTELYNYWNSYHSKNKRSDLKMSKNEFFDNAINYNEAQHDDLHKLLNPIPIYTRVLKDSCEVELDENKFHKLSHDDKLAFVYEEVMIMSYERFKNIDYRIAYKKMLKKFIISHAPIWSLIFIIENYIELHIPKFNHFKILENERNNS